MNPNNLETGNEVWNQKTKFDKAIGFLGNLDVVIGMLIMSVIQSALGYGFIIGLGTFEFFGYRLLNSQIRSLQEVFIPLLVGAIMIGIILTLIIRLTKTRKKNSLNKSSLEEKETMAKEFLSEAEFKVEDRKSDYGILIAFAIMALAQTAIGWYSIVKVLKTVQTDLIELTIAAVFGMMFLMTVMVYLERSGFFEGTDRRIRNM